MNHIMNVICGKCKKTILFLDPNFCCFCGEKVSKEAKAKATTITEQEWQKYKCHQRSW